MIRAILVKPMIMEKLKPLLANLILIQIMALLFLNENVFSQDISDNKPLNVAILVYDDIYLLDFSGPLEVFFDTYSEKGEHLFNAFTVSQTKEFTPHTGQKIKADYTINDCPKPDVLIVPGGNLKLLQGNSELREWLLNTAKNSQNVMSVCTGAFILADAGLLDSLEITTWYGALDNLQKSVPSATVVRGVRYTDNGKVLTTAGVSAGIDGALFLVSKIFGNITAKRTAKYMDYEYWK